MWQAFIDSCRDPQSGDRARIDGWHKIMKPFAAIRMWGGRGRAGVCGAIGGDTGGDRGPSFGCLDSQSRTAQRYGLRRRADRHTYVLDYDYVVLLRRSISCGSMASGHRWLPWDKVVMETVWIAPIVARQVAQFAYLPLGLATAVIVASSPSERQGITIRRWTWSVCGDVTGLPVAR